jgi:hypothetical protein
VTAFSTSETPSNVADFATSMHVARQQRRWLTKRVRSENIFLGKIIFEILNKKD